MLTSTHYCDGRLCEINESLSDLTCTNQALVGVKAKCEQELNSLGLYLDEVASEAGMSEDRALIVNILLIGILCNFSVQVICVL